MFIPVFAFVYNIRNATAKYTRLQQKSGPIKYIAAISTKINNKFIAQKNFIGLI